MFAFDFHAPHFLSGPISRSVVSAFFTGVTIGNGVARAATIGAGECEKRIASSPIEVSAATELCLSPAKAPSRFPRAGETSRQA